MKDFHIIKDFAIIATIISAFLYALGYLNETVYLEGFELNNSELAPDASTAITLGFRYVFLNTFGAIILITILGPLLLVLLGTMKEDFHVLLANYDKLMIIYRNIIKITQWQKFKYFVLLSIPALIVLACIHSINTASEKAAAFKTEAKKTDCITIKNDKEIKTYEGKVVRIRDNMVLFWSPKENKSRIFPSRSVIEIQYTENRLHKPCQKEMDEPQTKLH